MELEDEVKVYEDQMERIMTAYKARMLHVLKAAELTPPQFYALYTISRLTRTKMSPLADELGLSMGAASTLVDRLVTRGLVERDADAADRRAVFVSLSEKGRGVLAEAKRTRMEILIQVFGLLAPEVRRQLLTSFDALVVAWETLPPLGTADFACLDD
jgi:DNA-binding MarR family transcriptional regulator